MTPFGALLSIQNEIRDAVLDNPSPAAVERLYARLLDLFTQVEKTARSQPAVCTPQFEGATYCTWDLNVFGRWADDAELVDLMRNMMRMHGSKEDVGPAYGQHCEFCDHECKPFMSAYCPHDTLRYDGPRHDTLVVWVGGNRSGGTQTSRAVCSILRLNRQATEKKGAQKPVYELGVFEEQGSAARATTRALALEKGMEKPARKPPCPICKGSKKIPMVDGPDLDCSCQTGKPRPAYDPFHDV